MSEFLALKRAKRQRWLFLIIGIIIGCLVTNYQLKRPLNDLQSNVNKLKRQVESLDRLMDDKKIASKNQDSLIAKEKLIKHATKH
jgi:Na+/glutamate symporter